MPTETEIIDQVTAYCAWLEQELGVPMHRNRVIVPTRPATGAVEGETGVIPARPAHPNRRPGRLALALVVAAMVATIAGVAYLVTDSPRTQHLSPPAPDNTPGQTTPAGTVVEPSTPATYAPLELPDGLVVWDVGAIVMDRPVMTQQLFGSYGTANTLDVALLLKIQPATPDNTIDRSMPTVTVRGVAADNFFASPDSPDGTSLEWVENGFVIEATGTIPVADAVTLLDGLRWRAEPSQGFDPASSNLPLVVEESSIDKPWSDAVVFYITGPQGPADTTASPSLTDRIDVPGEAAMIVGDAPSLGALTPELVMNGVREPDGSITVVDPHDSSNSTPVQLGIRIEPDGTVVRFSGDQALWPTLTAALRPATNDQLAGLAGAANQRLLRLPPVASTSDGVAQVVLRGRVATNPSTICLRIAADEQCRSARAQQQMKTWTEVVEIGTRWFIVGRQPATDPPPVAFAWQPGNRPTADDAIQPDLTAVVGDDLLWYTEVSGTPHAVGSGHITAQGTTVDMLGRPSTGAVWTGWARPPWMPADTSTGSSESPPITPQPSTTIIAGTGDVAVTGADPGRVHPEQGTYVLQPDDLFVAKIASRFKVRLSDLLTINGWTLDNNLVIGYPQPGTTIKIPPGWTEPTNPTSETTSP